MSEGYCVGTWNVLPGRDEPFFEPCDYGGAPSWLALKPASPIPSWRPSLLGGLAVEPLEQIVLRPMQIRIRRDVWVGSKTFGWWSWRYAVVYCADEDRARVAAAVELCALALRLFEFIYARVPCVVWKDTA